jgi:hypothetical protein
LTGVLLGELLLALQAFILVFAEPASAVISAAWAIGAETDRRSPVLRSLSPAQQIFCTKLCKLCSDPSARLGTSMDVSATLSTEDRNSRSFPNPCRADRIVFGVVTLNTRPRLFVSCCLAAIAASQLTTTEATYNFSLIKQS